MGQRRGRTAASVVAVCVLLAGCSAAESGPNVGSASSGTPSSSGAGAPSLTVVLHQTRLDVAPGIVSALTGNSGAAPVTVTALRIEWPGFAEPATADLTQRFPPDGYPLAPGLKADLPVRFATAACDGVTGSTPAPGAPPVVVATVDGAEVSVAVTDPESLVMMQRLWREACARQRISEIATVAFGDEWTESTVDGTASLRGTLVLTRNGTTGPPVSVDDVGGSVLIEQVPVEDGPPPLVTLRRDAPSATMAVDLLTTGRCDPHGLSESTTSFVLSANLGLAGGPPVTFLVSVPEDVRGRMLETIYAGCGLEVPSG